MTNSVAHTHSWLFTGVCGFALALAPSASAWAQADEAGKAESSGATSEILVRGNRTLNVDIRRTSDDIQPYIVFDAEQIRQSGAQNIEDFLQARLPANVQRTTTSQIGPQTSQQGRIDLRGLGADQTLILIDGRRQASVSTGDSFGQPNIRGISLSQIERIEVLPATASGIYGGGATGGVLNIILKRNYSGIDVNADYGSAFDGGARQFRIGINGGFSFEDGRTQVLFSASHSEARVLYSTQRDFVRRGTALQLRNDPTNVSILFGGANICAADGEFDCSTDPLTLKSGATLGGAFTSIPDGYAGPGGDGGAGLATNAGKLQLDRNGVPIWTAPNTTSYSANVRRAFTDGIDAYVDFSREESRSVNVQPTQLPLFVAADSPANPFDQDVLSFLSIADGSEQRRTIKNTRVTLGAIVRLPFNWSATPEYSWQRSRSFSSLSSVLGVLDEGIDEIEAAAFRDREAFPLANANSLFAFNRQNNTIDSTLQTASLRLSGPIVKLPGGNVTATALLEHRREVSDENVNFSSLFGFDRFLYTPASRSKVSSAYLELRAPIVASSNGVPGVDTLELMGSVRHDNYKTEFSGSSIPVPGATGPFPALRTAFNDFNTTNFTVGFRYAPIPDITFRGSYGTGFLPPKLSQIRTENPTVFPPFLIALLDLRDPARGNELIPGPLTLIGGGSPDLKPEKSKSLSLGVIFTPSFVPGLRLSVDYTSIRKSDEVTTQSLFYFLENPDAFPGRVTRGPAEGGQPGPITQVDFSAINLATSQLKAIDIQADYSLVTKKAGSFRLYAAGTNTLELSRKVFATDIPVERVDFGDGPLKWRVNFGLDWSKGPWKLGWNAQYYSSYQVCQSFLPTFICQGQQTSQGAKRLPVQTYHDVSIRYDFQAASGVLADADIGITVNNVFNSRGPIIASGLTYANGPASYIDPRLRRFNLALHKHF